MNVPDDVLVVELLDGRTIAVPLTWYPRLPQGNATERAHWRFIGEDEGIHCRRVAAARLAEGCVRLLKRRPPDTLFCVASVSQDVKCLSVGHRVMSVPISAMTTRAWWSRRDRFELFVSQAVVEEASRGNAVAAAGRMALLEGIPVLRLNAEIDAIADQLLRARPGRASSVLTGTALVAPTRREGP